MNTIEIPVKFLKAIDRSDPEPYFALHREYVNRYRKPDGNVTDKKAWEMLEADLQEYGLPGRYSSYGSFRVERSRCFIVSK